MFSFKLTHEQKHVHMMSKGTFTISETNSCSCKRSTKKGYNYR
jgi:hypothetical protein